MNWSARALLMPRQVYHTKPAKITLVRPNGRDLPFLSVQSLRDVGLKSLLRTYLARYMHARRM
jgi:hypothetical protein